MKNRLPVFLLPFLILSYSAAQAEFQPFYFSKDATEAQLTFSNQVEFLSDKAPDENLAMQKIDDQISHLDGSMEGGKYRAGLRNDYSVLDIVTEPKSGAPGTYVAKYRFEGAMVLEKGWDKDYFELIMPINVDTVFDASVVTGRHGEKSYPCLSDSRYSNPYSFAYFWNPRLKGCPLKEGVHYTRTRAKITRLANTKKTYPEYSRLAHEGVISMSVLLGIDNEDESWNPLDSRDINAINYRTIRSELKSRGYQPRRWSDQEIRALTGETDARLPFVEELAKETPKGKISIRMFFGPSSIFSKKSRSFHFLLKDSLENQSVLIYGGHSGYGTNYDIPLIEKTYGIKVQPNLSRYQIYLFNSCSSYNSYTSAYFAMKRTETDPNGTKNLDILANGLIATFAAITEGNLSLIRAIDQWATSGKAKSYQDIVLSAPSQHFFGISGDEDNPTEPASSDAP